MRCRASGSGTACQKSGRSPRLLAIPCISPSMRPVASLGPLLQSEGRQVFPSRRAGKQALEAASFSRFPGLPLAGFGKGSSWFSGSVSNIGGTEGASHCHINCHIFPIRPAPDCDITRACDGSWQEMLFFPAWPQVSTSGSLEQNISDHIMPGYPVRSCAATQRVISHAITW